MLFLFAKKKITCKQCKSQINRGELFIRTAIKNKATGAYFSFSHHYECYIEYFTVKIRSEALYWMGQQESPKKLGRPKIHSDPKLINQLKTLRRYHLGVGNWEKADEILRRINILGNNSS